MTAPKGSGALFPPTPSETPPKDLSHVRVGVPFESKVDARCGCGCGESTLGKTAAIVENTRSHKKRGYLETCVQARPELLARRDAGSSEEDFLSA